MTDELLITISGPPASGTSSLARDLSDMIGAEVLSGGDIFKEMAEEREVTIEEFSKIAESDPTIDKSLDDRLKSVIKQHPDGDYGDDLIIDSRLSGWHADGSADLSVCLKAPIEVRSNRIDSRDESKESLRKREESEKKRYMEYYGIDIEDLSVYDIVIDTRNFTPISTAKLVKKALEELE